jgi:pyruvate dehydrogenase (quinone)
MNPMSILTCRVCDEIASTDRHSNAAGDGSVHAGLSRQPDTDAVRCRAGETVTVKPDGRRREMSETVADTLVGALQQIGVKQIFALIGDSLNPLADAVRRSEIEWIGVRHEEGAALAAAGQAKLTGRLGVCAGTTGPGSTHLVAGLYEASRDHAPVLALSGDMPRNLQGTDYIQTTAPDLLFRDVALYTETIASAGQAPAVIHQAIAAAYAGRGVAHLTLPQDVIGAKAHGEVPSIATLKPRAQITPNDADIAEIVWRLDKAERVVIMCGAGCHGAADELRDLSDRLKAPLVHSVKGKDIMPYDDPHWMGGIGMIGTRPVYDAIMHSDLLLMLGTDYPYANFLPSKPVVVQIDERAEVLGRRAPTVFGALGSWPSCPRRATAAFSTMCPRRGTSGTRCWTARPTRRAARIVSTRRRSRG